MSHQRQLALEDASRVTQMNHIAKIGNHQLVSSSTGGPTLSKKFALSNGDLAASASKTGSGKIGIVQKKLWRPTTQMTNNPPSNSKQNSLSQSHIQMSKDKDSSSIADNTAQILSYNTKHHNQPVCSSKAISAFKFNLTLNKFKKEVAANNQLQNTD